ncbi:MAG: histidine kinase [Desulfuromonas sp.]|nr:MAG: histidine kinase [Desulfuromonas sp.]
MALFFKSLIGRVILLNILLLAIGFATYTLFHIRREQVHIIDTTRENAHLLVSTIEKALFNSMRLGNSEDVQSIIELVGRSPRLAGLRIFHPDGTVLKSSKPTEIGRKVNLQDHTLFLSNRVEGTYRVDGQEMLGIVKPIVTDERCFLCHGYGRKVVGVLNLNIPLEYASRRVNESSQLFMLSTLMIVALLAGGISLILIRFVRRPIQEMVDTMAQVEKGDLSVRMEPRFPDEIGSLMHSFNSMVDTLEDARKELEVCHYQQMERADRLASVGEMATGIAHEVKNPLAGISGAISVLTDDFAEGDSRREIISEVLEQIRRLDKTSNDLLHFGKPGVPEFGYADVNELVNKTLFFASQHSEARKIHRTKELTRDLPPVWVDEKQVQQVLLNISLNAIQAMGDEGTLSVQTELASERGKEWVKVTISDTGKGIPPEALEKIFVPFFTTKTQGTGLGLPICKRLVEQQGGRIHVESRVGVGTTFKVLFPVADLSDEQV